MTTQTMKSHQANEYIAQDPFGVIGKRLSDGIDNIEKSFYDLPDWGLLESYDWIDLQLQKALSFGGVSGLARGTKSIGRAAELSLYSSLTDSVKKYLDGLSGNERELSVIDGARNVINQWYDINIPLMNAAFEELFTRGFSAGVIVGGGQLDTGDKLVMQLLEDSNFRIGSRIRLFGDETIEKFEEIIHSAFGPNQEFNLDKLIHDMNQAVPARRFALERIARTEVGQTSGTGRFYGWYQKPEDIYYYQYFWHSTPDSRRRNIKKIRSAYGPLTWDEAWFLWSHNHQFDPEIGKFVMGAIQCRCTIARSPIDEEFRGNRFIGQEDQFIRTLDTFMPWDE